MAGFEPAHFAHTETLALNAPPDRVFPLFTPLRERAWAHDWSPTILYSDSPDADTPGTVFTSPGPDGLDVVWCLAELNAQQWRVHYVRVMPGLHLADLTIVCHAAEGNRTQAIVTYAFTALSPAGNAALDDLAASHPGQVMGWEAAINHTLQAG